MHKNLAATASVLAFLLIANTVSAQVSKQGNCPDPNLNTAGVAPRALAHNRYTVCFVNDAWIVDEPTNTRFTNRDRVEVDVEYFNFLRYTLSFDVKEEKSETYQYLAKLWGSVLDPSVLNFMALGGAAPLTADPLTVALRDLYRRSLALDKRLTALAATYRKPGLQKVEARALRDAVFGPGASACAPANYDTENNPAFGTPAPGGALDDPLTLCTVNEILRGLTLSYARLSQLVVTNDPAFLTVLSGDKKTLYTLVTGMYTDVRKRAETFRALAEKTVNVETKKAGKHEAGTRITLALSALDEGGARSPIADVNYFVETTMPLIVHGGVALSSLHDVTFDKVKRASAFGEEDLFIKKSESSSSKNFSAFLSWKLFSLLGGSGPNSSKAALLASLGTDVAAPGKKIFAGPSVLLFERMAFTVGVVFAKEANGELQTLEPNVFRVIREQPKGRIFFALTSKVH